MKRINEDIVSEWPLQEPRMLEDGKTYRRCSGRLFLCKQMALKNDINCTRNTRLASFIQEKILIWQLFLGNNTTGKIGIAI